MNWIKAVCLSVFMCVPVVQAQATKQQTKQVSGLKSLTEEQRKSIYWEYSGIADRIRKETYKAYPVDGPLDMAKERARDDMSEKLYEKYTLPMQKRYKVSPTDLLEIEMEGLKNRWPKPPKPPKIK